MGMAGEVPLPRCGGTSVHASGQQLAQGWRTVLDGAGEVEIRVIPPLGLLPGGIDSHVLKLAEHVVSFGIVGEAALAKRVST